MKTVAIVQARMGSTRLPGKVLMEIAGQPMLAWVINRIRRARALDDIVVATSINSIDDVIEKLCVQREWPCFRGDEYDLLDRYYQAAIAFKAEIIVRITSDCPLIDPEVIDTMVTDFQRRVGTREEVDYLSNNNRRTFPHGLELEVFSIEALTRIWHETTNPYSREHVTYQISENPDRFVVADFLNPGGDQSGYRWTVDTANDLAHIRWLVAHLSESGETCTTDQLLCMEAERAHEGIP